MQDSESVLVLIALELLVVHGTIRGAKIHGSFGDLFDAAAPTDGLVVDLNIGILLVVFIEPLRVHGVRKRCARTVDREGAIGPQNASYGENYQEHSSDSLHASSPSKTIVFSKGNQVCSPIVTALLQPVHCCLNRRSAASHASSECLIGTGILEIPRPPR